MIIKLTDIPPFKTKVDGLTDEFDLKDPSDRQKYFQAKAGEEIKIIQDYLKDKTFVAHMMGKKSSGKGTYTKLFAEAVGVADKIRHVSVGDIVRNASNILEGGGQEKEELVKFLEKNYRGFQSLEDIFKSFESRSTEKLMPTELILALLKWELHEEEKKTIFLDDFPRDLDQVSYSMFFRELIGYREDPDFFVFISLPEMVVDERMKTRAICPKCQVPRNVRLLPTKEVGYDEEKKEFYLKCDNPECEGERMVGKEGDEKGIEPIRGRLEKDGEVMEKLLQIQGVPKVLLRNSIHVSEAKEYADDYEITPAYKYEWDKKNKEVKTSKEPWTVKDDEGIDSYSLLAPPVALSLIKQTAEILKKLT